MEVELLVTGLTSYILVFFRMVGMIVFNPLFARKNVPGQVRAALVLGITILIAPLLPVGTTATLSELALFLAMIQELLLGVAFGFVFQCFYYLLFTAGDIIDMGFGLSMAKAFDPGANVQVSMSGNLFQFLFVLYILTTNSHLVMIKMMADSYGIVPMGEVTFGAHVGSFIMSMFADAFLLMMQLTLPFIAAAIILEISMGILMKLIPQINVFSINFQLKIFLGFSLLFLFSNPISMFLIEYVDTALRTMEALLDVF